MTTVQHHRGYDADVLIVGGGIVGVSTAMQLIERHPGLGVLLLGRRPHSQLTSPGTTAA